MANFEGVREERTGKRDESISNWHRKIGWNAPVCDIDALVVAGEAIMDTNLWNEYDNSECMALVEYKYEAAQIDLNQSSVKANKSLADKAKLPFLIVRYPSDKSWFKVLFHNKAAKEKLLEWTKDRPPVDVDAWKHLTERQFVAMLYKLRNREADEKLLNTLAG